MLFNVQAAFTRHRTNFRSAEKFCWTLCSHKLMTNQSEVLSAHTQSAASANPKSRLQAELRRLHATTPLWYKK